MSNPLFDLLAKLDSLSSIPHEELLWLAEHARLESYQEGTMIASKDTQVVNLWIILRGRIIIRVDRGAGPKLVTEWRRGQVVGRLPYSRMAKSIGETYIQEDAEVIVVHSDFFPAMIIHCPLFTAHTVHTMIDRVRIFNTSDMQDEKMISMGKLAAGMAHELNNPASAAMRDAKLLQQSISGLDNVAQRIGTMGLTEAQFDTIKKMRENLRAVNQAIFLSPIQKADHYDKVILWLEQKKIDPALAGPLTDTKVALEDLDLLAGKVPVASLETALTWIITGHQTQLLTEEIERATEQICKLVNLIKKFTYMDTLGEKKLIDIESGIRDTLDVLAMKTRVKKAIISIQIEKDLPRVYANGSELNQVWFSLFDNALDAISESGNIRIEAHAEPNSVVVCCIDDGPGIAEDTIARIFDPFFTTKPPGQGTGLGLDITRRLLRRYHGDISVQSQPGQTEFKVQLVTE